MKKLFIGFMFLTACATTIQPTVPYLDLNPVRFQHGVRLYVTAMNPTPYRLHGTISCGEEYHEQTTQPVILQPGGKAELRFEYPFPFSVDGRLTYACRHELRGGR